MFSSDRDGNWEIYIMNPDGTRQERLTYDRVVDCEPVISPKGDRILFTSNRGGTRDLYLMDVDGRNVRPLFGVSEAYRTEPAWSPDGKKIAYSQRAFGSNSQIYKINLTTHKATQLTDDGSNYSGNWFSPRHLSVSPSPSLLSTLWSDVKIQ